MKYLLYVSQNYSFAIVRPLQQAILEQGDQVRWFLAGHAVNPKYLRNDEIQLDTVEQVVEYQPDVVLVPGNNVPRFIPGFKVALFHGFNSGKRSDDVGHFAIRGCFDLYCTQGPNTTNKFEAKAKIHQHFSVKETGWATLDPLHKPNIDVSTDKKRPVILYCSTFTKDLTSTEALYNEISAISKLDKWQWLIQFHPKMDAETVAKYRALENDNLTFIETDNVIPLLHQADLMVCDTSSILLMFLQLNKPVVTFKNNASGPHLIDIDNPKLLEESIEYGLSRPKSVLSEIQYFNSQVHPYSDGMSSQRVINAIKQSINEKQQLKPKPLNVIRNLKARKKLDYWNFWPQLFS